MLEPQTPENEVGRLAALRSLDILDSLPEDRFDRLTRLAASIFRVPIALVSLVDAERQWFKSRFGLDAPETPRNISFCGHAILGNSVFVVPNAVEDSRFADNPLVTGGPEIRFYAGAPLSSLEGYKVGTLCVISPKPRQVSAKESGLLADLAGIVEQELASAEMARARDAAMAASQAKSRFLANMSHEIKTPLNAVIGLSDLLREADLPAEHRESVETIHTSGTALLSVINDILDLSKIEADKLELEFAPFSLLSVANDVVKLTRSLAREKPVTVSLHCTGEVPDAVSGDATRLRQILLNLAANAVKFTERGRVTITIHGRKAEGPRQRFEIEVADTGIGMAEDAVNEVFGEFIQADSSASRRFGGTGLGLSIARQLVQRMGGRISAESTEGEGSCFRVEIPFGVVGVAPKPPEVEEATPGLRVLAVDDNAVNLKILSRQLQKLGCSVVAASSGADALAIAEREPLDLVFMDLQMPGMDGMDGMDGIETTERLRAKDQLRSLPVIALTASAFATDRGRCMEAGMNGFLTKPVQLNELRKALQNPGTATLQS